MIKSTLNRLVLLLSATVCLYLTSAQSQAENSGLKEGVHDCSISVSTKKSQYASGEAISLTISLKNVGSADLTVERGYFAHYGFTVLFGSEQHVPLTLYGKKTLGRIHAVGSLAMLTLKPGEQASMEIPLSRLFDLSLSGNYEISVSRRIKDPQTNAWISMTSNQIEIGVDDSFITHIIH